MSNPAPPPYAAYPPQPQTEGNAVGALILSIVSWTVCPVVPAIIALVLANKAQATIDASNGWRTGSGLVLAARIISWANIALLGLALVVGIVIAIIAIAASA